MNNRHLLLPLSVLLLLSGCTKSPSTAAQDETVNRLPGAKTVALIPLNNDDIALTEKMRIAVESGNTNPPVAVVTTPIVDTAGKASDISKVTVPDAADALLLGRKIGADAVLFGRIHAATLNDAESYVERTRCNDNICWRVKVACKERTVALSAEVGMVDVMRAESIFDETLQHQRQWQSCADELKPLPSRQTGARQLADTLAEEIAQRVHESLKTGRF